MAQQKPVGLYNGEIEGFAAGDTIIPAYLGTGTPTGTKFLRDDGTWAVIPILGGTGSAIVTFADPTSTKKGASKAIIAVTGLTNIIASDIVELWMSGTDSTPTHNTIEHSFVKFKLTSTNRIVGTGFTIEVDSEFRLNGSFKIRFRYG